LVDLGPFYGLSANCTGISSSTDISVNSAPDQYSGPHDDHAYLFDNNGVWTDLGILAGYKESFTTGINDSAQIVGYSLKPGSNGWGEAQPEAFLWANGALTDLGTLGGAQSEATAINNAGQIVGYSTTTAADVPYDAFLYSNGKLQDLGTLGGTYSQATGINNSGQIVGYTTVFNSLAPARTRAFLWNGPGNVTDLGTLGGASSQAAAINDAGEVVGNSTTAVGEKAPSAFLWSNGQMTNLGTLGGIFSYATGINESGQIVGYSSTGPGLPGFTTPHAFLYSDGTMTDLNSLLPSGSGWVLTTAMAINNQGAIVGMGYLNGQQDGYVLYVPTQGGGGGGSVGTHAYLQASGQTSVYGQSVTFTVTVNPETGGSGTPAGPVTFYDGTTPLNTVMLDNGAATLSIANLPVGVDAISASYGGNSQFAASGSSSVDVNVQKDGTVVVVTCASNPSFTNQAVAFTAVVSPLAPGGGTATGTVTFMDGMTSLGTFPLSGGAATGTFSNWAVGSHSITAVYSGDSNFLPQTSPAVGHTVKTATYGSRTIISTTAQQSTVGQPVKLTATVENTTRISGTPTGQVKFMDGPTVLGTLGLRGGKATLTTSRLPLGANRIWVYYGGDRDFSPSTSAILVETIEPESTRTRATFSPRLPVAGQPVTLVASVGGVGKGKVTPNGSVSFYDGSTFLETVALNNGKAYFTTSSLSVGTHTIRMTYSGTAAFAPSSASQRLTVRQSKTSKSKVLVGLLENGRPRFSSR